MNLELSLFYFFATLALISAVMVISLTNAVHSVLFLIIVFCNVAGLLLLSGAEFLAFLLLIVYVGAIAVLFLFVVMMLNIKTSTFHADLWSTLPVSLLIFVSFTLQIISNLNINFDIYSFVQYPYFVWDNWFLENYYLNNIEVVGTVLYTKYSFVFLLSGFILLIAMIGAIVLTMHQKSNVKKQIIGIQLSRDSEGVVKFVRLRR